MPMPNRNVEGDYRYAYQGQEKDPETGKEAFELRLWDSRIGRWLSPDPYGQFHSPYLGMGNNPINGIDPDGGCWITTTDADRNTTRVKCADGNIGDIQKGDNGYLWRYVVGETKWDLANYDNIVYIGDKTSLLDWNGDFMRAATGDAISFKGGFGAGSFLQGGLNVEATWILRGNDASFSPYLSIGPSLTIGTGVAATESVGFTKKNYNGTVNSISASDLAGYSATGNVGGAYIGGASIDLDVSLDQEFNRTWTSLGVNLELGVKGSPLTVVDIQGGVAHTTIMVHIGLKENRIYFNNPLNNETSISPYSN